MQCSSFPHDASHGGGRDPPQMPPRSLNQHRTSRQQQQQQQSSSSLSRPRIEGSAASSSSNAISEQLFFFGASLDKLPPHTAFASSQFPSTASSMSASLFSYRNRGVPGSVSLCSIRDAEQGIYEYLAEKHEPLSIVAYSISPKPAKPFSVPVRISGWLWRKEGLFRKFRRRFCVFEAESATLQIFASDDMVDGKGKLLNRFVLTQVALADKATREFRVQGYVQERELHKRQSDSMARRKSSLPKALPGDRQRFYLPEEETVRAVGDKSLAVWAHCFRNHMKSAGRLKRLRRAMGLAQLTGNGYGDEDCNAESDDDDEDADTDDEINPDFVFEEPERQRKKSRAGQGSRYTRGNNNSEEDEDERNENGLEAGDEDDRVLFDQESDGGLRITASYQALPSTTFFEGHESENTDLYNGNEPHLVDSQDFSRSGGGGDPERLKRSKKVSSSQASSSSASSSAFASGSSSTSSALSSIWEDEELLSYRVDFDAIHKQQQLSVGAFGEVWLAKYRSSQSVVVKHLKGDGASHTRSDIQLFLKEIKTVCKLSHARIVAFLGVAWTMERDVQLMLEFVPGGDLRAHLDHVKRTNNAQGFRGQWTWTTHQWRIAIDVIEALVYLHSLSPVLLHCDIKSHNVLVGEDLRAKLTDFGISRYVEAERSIAGTSLDQAGIESLPSGWSGLGTGRWMAPEILSGEADYSVASDVYAFGVVLSEVDTCEMPFHERIVDDASGRVVMSEDILVHQIMRQGWRPTFSTQCPDLVRELALQCLEADPKERPTSLEVAYRLRKAASQRENAEDLISQTTDVRAGA
ncbi:unnamed protein product [Globisporangium polare]